MNKNNTTNAKYNQNFPIKRLPNQKDLPEICSYKIKEYYNLDCLWNTEKNK